MSSKSDDYDASAPAPADQFAEFLDGPKRFAKQSQLLINRCTKPTRNEFQQIFQVVGIGFLIMGFIGFVVKLIHIPINNIIVGAA
ncbi:protein translocase SEC61 complex gamma subunit, archaeal and eukaryotic [Allomyces macrogynus ATCC 38327]|uniref:Protein translocase SEC61 complex gamma subunit, archaeal and eukaryotic n=1 Tax=Allomyces macrogynus (strain ATCC 38327) TaxID=578462 RepID=A0A0L0T0L1_ALLM3|nr:Sec61p translocation complex subunit [Allomyces javanicus]KNE68292.1 protein translocase SEC61 complex gamma subunit, archaeal and eukaryotic [Allomyces macrogynus ATCC 38327]|eukprot:KNE68292.1 protein translocase SEC61 complex gamma subunit, archaeal and eukaryotic [Allomyces macrogynus ATCC 38327]